MNVFIYLFIIFHIVFSQDTSTSWHLLNTTISSYKDDELGNYKSSELEKIRRNWNLSVSIDSKSYKELYFEKAFDIIYKHQHPEDCTKAKFLVSSGYYMGFGSEIHVESYGLAVAMELGNKVILQ